MKLWPIVLLLSSCTLDHVAPDRLTIGGGRSAWAGEADMGYGRSADLDGDTESYGAALSWDLPSFEDHRRAMGPDERQALSEALRDHDEKVEHGHGMNLRDGVDPPPVEVLYLLAAFLLVFVLVVVMRSRQSNRWR